MKSIILQADSIMPMVMTTAVILFVVVLVFLAIRELITWYWKIDRMIENQHETNRLLSEILKEYRGEETNVR